MRLHFNMRFFFTRTFCLLLILLLMTGVLSAVMLTRLQNLYADQDSTQIDSLVTMVSEMIEERLSSRMGLLNETSHFPFQKPGSKSRLDSFLNSLSIKLNANELLKEKIGSTRFLVTDLNGILVGGVDATSDALAAMEAKDLAVTVFQDAAGQGGGGVDAALKLIAGETVPAYVDVPYQLVTPDNMADFK